MVWQIELRPSARNDLILIFRHLVRVHHEAFGLDLHAAQARATTRIARILDDTERLARAPHRDTQHHVFGYTYRHLTFDRAIYWFSLDETRRVVTVEGIFHGGQDHLGRMLDRLTGDGGAG